MIKEAGGCRLLLLSVLVLALAGCQDGPAEPLGVAGPDLNQGQTKTAVCHYDADSGTYHKITIADPALDAHIAHGDLMPGEAFADGSGFLNDECVPMAYVLGASYNTAVFGGPGGSPWTETCPAGAVAVGMAGFWGYYDYHTGWRYIIGQVAMRCAQFRGDGTLGSLSTSGTFGEGTGFNSSYAGASFDDSCSAGQILVGGFGRYENGAYIAQLGGSCASVPRVLTGDGGHDSTIGPWGIVPTSLLSGTATCNAGDVATGITGNAGWAVDKVGFVCRPITVQPLN